VLGATEMPAALLTVPNFRNHDAFRCAQIWNLIMCPLVWKLIAWGFAAQ